MLLVFLDKTKEMLNNRAGLLARDPHLASGGLYTPSHLIKNPFSSPSADKVAAIGLLGLSRDPR